MYSSTSLRLFFPIVVAVDVVVVDVVAMVVNGIDELGSCFIIAAWMMEFCLKFHNGFLTENSLFGLKGNFIKRLQWQLAAPDASLAILVPQCDC
jgi:hypothetical protein